MQAILCWQGGKRSLVKELLKRMPPHKTYVEPFFGAGHLFFAKEPSEVEVINDIDPFLMNFYKKFRDMPSFECDMTPDKAKWEKIKAEKEKRQSLPVCDYLYLVKLSHGCSLVSFGRENVMYGECDENPRSCLVNLVDRNFPKYKARLQKAVIKAEDWEDVTTEFDNPDTFIYLDPPYWGTDCPYSQCSTSPSSLALAVKTFKGRWLLSYNEHPEVRKTFANYYLEEVRALYGTHGRGTKPVSNLIIRNYDGYYN